MCLFPGLFLLSAEAQQALPTNRLAPVLQVTELPFHLVVHYEVPSILVSASFAVIGGSTACQTGAPPCSRYQRYIRWSPT